MVEYTAHSDCEALRLDADRNRRRSTFLLPFDRPRRLQQDRIVILSARAWFHRFAQVLADTYPYGGLRYVPDGIAILPYQLEPALAMLRDRHPRLLIADDVGLGKTIEAGLILRELAMRQDGFRAILLVPAGLRHQWSDELSTRFALAATMADALWLREAGRALPADINPWSLPGIYLSSFDFVKRPEALHPLEDVRWDLAVVDEAHAATLSTDRRAALDAVAKRAQRLMLLTATPPGDPLQFEGLCRIGAVPNEGPIRILERTRERHAAGSRRSSVITVHLSDAEQRMHRSLERYTALMWSEAARTANAEGRLVSTLLRKRALSSATALERSLRRRRDLLSGSLRPSSHQLLLPLPGEQLEEDDVSDASLSSWVFGDHAAEEHWLEESLSAASAASNNESKARALEKFLTRVREPTIVFTEYRDTLEWLQGRLHAGGLQTCAIHGGLTPWERRNATREFTRDSRTLLATDAAAEGLNLQHRCRLVVHYELPWNPARLLQRAGRVDRIGQARRVHEVALVAADTAETLVIAPFVRRAARWADSKGRASLAWLTESRIADAVFDGQRDWVNERSIRATAAVPIELVDDASVEAQRLEARRALARSPKSSVGMRLGEIPLTTTRRSSLAPGFVLLFELKSVQSGEVLEQSVLALHWASVLDLASRKASDLRRRVSDVLDDMLPTALSMARTIGEARAEALRPRAEEACRRTRERARSVRQMHESTAHQLVQIGLFERQRRQTIESFQQTTALFDGSGIATTTEPVESKTTASADLRAVLLILPR